MNRPHIHCRPGIQFKNGKLYQFATERILVMRLWPQPQAWVKTPRKGWKHDRKWADRFLCGYIAAVDVRPIGGEPTRLGFVDLPGLDEIETEEEKNSIRELRYRHALQQWRAMHQVADAIRDVPLDVRECLVAYTSRRWHMLNLLARCPGAVDLQGSNPALCFALASNWAFHKPAPTHPMRAARRLVWKKQKEILGWLGFPATNSCREILRKVPSKVLSVERLLYLRDALHNPELAGRICHLPLLNAEALRLATDPKLASYVTQKLLRDACCLPVEQMRPALHRLLCDTLRMDEQLGGGRCPKRFESEQHLIHTHDMLADRVQRLVESMPGRHQPAFPPPPFVGTASIRPLTTANSMIVEGRAMQHCAASYISQVASGSCYLYRVTEPVRATLEIRCRGSSWLPGQLLMARNYPIGEAIRSKVFAALLQSPITPPQPGHPEEVAEGKSVSSKDDLSCFGSETRRAIESVLRVFSEPPKELATSI